MATATPNFIPTSLTVENGGELNPSFGPQFGLDTPGYSASYDEFSHEPSLIEELGINIDHIKRKTFSVLYPFISKVDSDLVDDADLAGPFCYAFLLGFVLLMRGKWCYGNIYGFFSVGCMAMFLLLNLMSSEATDGYKTISVLGYCLLPMVLLAITSIFISLSGVIGLIVAFICVLWCARSAAVLFTTPNKNHQLFLVLYPLVLYYACFALLTIF